ncbi:MAG: four-carbon acid sugar kinase family protein [Cyanobacteria bacterium REEB459]|nr:four-carbon acid sugar kinase family protein [Cyanobacteria bacterium REEB459]
MAQPKIIVLDDDPTGSQTVHSCLLLMRWDETTLAQGLQDSSPLCFVLTNSRALSPTAAEQVTRQVCHNLKGAIARAGIENFLIVSRSDSTLRGHYPIETDVIAQELGPFDAHFLVPAFFEGGRITRDSRHYLLVEGVPTPVEATEFARDSVFGYSTGYLPDYVAEKTGDRIRADQVQRFTLNDLRQGCLDRLLGLQGNLCCVVDGETQADLDSFAREVLTATTRGKRFLFRSAASLLTALAGLPPQPIAAHHMGRYARGKAAGVVVVGSHVQKTTQQLDHLLGQPGVTGIAVDVTQLQTSGPEVLLAAIEQQVKKAHSAGQTAVVYTSRQELSFATVTARLDFGSQVSALLMAVIQRLPSDIGFLISKGGITSNDTLSTGLNLTSARLLGQILPGVSVVKTPSHHPQFPDLPVVLFPGNVGDNQALVTVYQRLSQPAASPS